MSVSSQSLDLSLGFITLLNLVHEKRSSSLIKIVVRFKLENLSKIRIFYPKAISYLTLF